MGEFFLYRGLMLKIIPLALCIALAGCATNKLHFASYTSDVELVAIKNTNSSVDVLKVSGVDTCDVCNENSKIVWHAANANNGLYEGFSAIPVKDWGTFVQEALGSSQEAKIKAEIVINRIFLKTWNSPEYYACQVELTVLKGGSRLEGKGVVKIHGSGQKLLGKNLAFLDPEALEAIRLALKAAYLDATAMP